MLRLSILITLLLTTIYMTGCGALAPEVTTDSSKASLAIPSATALPATSDTSETAIRFLENRVKGDPDDIVAQNRLGGFYLQLLRETGNVSYLNLATRAAEASLKSVPAEQNAGGLELLAQAEFGSHDFAKARAHATKLITIEPGKKAAFAYGLLGDSLSELGEYDKAEAAYQQLQKLSRSGTFTLTRLARRDWLRGEVKNAEQLFTQALLTAIEGVPPSRETVAWCRWQLGELAFAGGDYETAEKHAREALTTYPGYFRGLAALGRVRAARNDLAGAIEQYEHAVRIIPEPVFVAALGDLYKLAGRDKEAAAQYALVEQTAKLSVASGQLYNRQLALFDADHDLKAEEAYSLARTEYEMRHDLYGADALAWTALKAGKVSAAQEAIKDALRLGTKDARLLYHAGMIAKAAGDQRAARDYLERALALNPQFDPLQSVIARKALAE